MELPLTAHPEMGNVTFMCTYIITLKEHQNISIKMTIAKNSDTFQKHSDNSFNMGICENLS